MPACILSSTLALILQQVPCPLQARKEKAAAQAAARRAEAEGKAAARALEAARADAARAKERADSVPELRAELRDARAQARRSPWTVD